MKHHLEFSQFHIVGNSLSVEFSGYVEDDAILSGNYSRPKVVLYFDNGKENRRLPLVLQDVQYLGNRCIFEGRYRYKLEAVYWSTRGMLLDSELTLKFSYGSYYDERAAFSLGEGAVECNEVRWICNTQENCFLLSPIAPKKSSALKRAIIRPLAKLFDLISLLLAFCLIPWFLLEALLAFIGIARWDKRVRSKNPLRRIVGHVNGRVSAFARRKITLIKLYKTMIQCLYKLCCIFKIRKNRITFISMRRTDLSGNFAFVYEQMKDRKDLDIHFILTYSNSVWMSLKDIFRFCYACAVSKVIVLDEFTPQIHYLDLRAETKLIQLWHACGAFKTFGFTRLGKPAGSPQATRNHRSYDYVTVSSTYCKRCHSEGFGISDEKIIPTGIARTDVFFDEGYKQRVRDGFYEQYPALKEKKILLFAPTFRGTVKENAYYPMERMDFKALYEAIGEEYAIIVKHHPFVADSHPIPEEYKEFILDLSAESELNDLLFVSDLIITDYSSLVFEAALLKIPMLFYVFDLNDYIRQRDFYFDLRLESPGKLVFSQGELTQAILQEDFGAERMDAFAKMFFDDFDGRSTERIVALINKALKE